MDLMIAMVKEKGIPFLEQFENYPHPFDKITLNDLNNPSEAFKDYGIDASMLNWVRFHIFLAKLNLDIENYSLARQIIEKA